MERGIQLALYFGQLVFQPSNLLIGVLNREQEQHYHHQPHTMGVGSRRTEESERDNCCPPCPNLHTNMSCPYDGQPRLPLRRFGAIRFRLSSFVAMQMYHERRR
jgi:hypothetical protein